MKTLIIFTTLVLSVVACSETVLQPATPTSSMSSSDRDLYRAEHKGQNPPVDQK